MQPDVASDFSTLYVFGAGGHGREIAWLAETAWTTAPEVVFLVDDPTYLVDSVDGHPVALLDDANFDLDCRFVVAVGDPADRRRIAGVLESRGARAATIVHPNVVRSERVTFGEGSIVFPGCVLTTNITLGQHVHLNLACTVSHDSRIGDFSSLSPGVHVAGNVQIGEGVFVGTGASIINGPPGSPLVIGESAMIAAGACVTGSVDAGAMVAGVPAVRKR